MSYAVNVPSLVAEYKAELREIERARWQKWHAFRDRVAAAHSRKKEAENVPSRS
jgi:hypothetical protein